MADRIITVTNPSVVTNDTLAGYNNYSDIDGQLGTTMTPTEAANGKTVTISDGVAHEVTTKPVGTTNGEFSSVISNAVTVDLVGTIILAEDDFAGQTIDYAYWSQINPQAGLVEITQDDELIFSTSGSSSTGARGNYLRSELSVGALSAQPLVFRIDFKTNETQRPFAFGFSKASDFTDNDNIFSVIQSTSTGADIRTSVKALGSATTQIHTIDVSSYVSFKMILTSTTADVYTWNGSAWVALGTQFTHTMSGDFYIGMSADNSTTLGGSGAVTSTYQNMYLTDADFATLNP